LAETALWAGERYLVVPDAFPRCVGHVLLLPRAHLASHMHAPEEGLPEFLSAQATMRAFLRDVFGAAAFYENGGARQEVPHAHLHGMPFAPAVRRRWLREGALRAVAGWEDARAECRAVGHYFYLETADRAFLVRDYRRVVRRIREQLVGQTEATMDPATGRMRRGGRGTVSATRDLWRAWARRGARG